MAQRVLLAFLREHLGSTPEGVAWEIRTTAEIVVADLFELVRRRTNLSWSHHREVAQLEPTCPAGGKISAGAIRPRSW